MDTTTVDAVVIGAGISGLVAAKCLRENGLSVVVLERSGEVGGLWTFRENDYGVMRFTHINVSKYNYCFSDFPFPDDVPDYPHNEDMAKYIVNYMKHFELQEHIHFYKKVLDVNRQGADRWRIMTTDVMEDGKTADENSEEKVYICKYVAVATGHHATPTLAKFRGQNTFTGEIIHSVDFNDAITNRIIGKKVLVVGIGNSAVDAAVNLASEGRSQGLQLNESHWTGIINLDVIRSGLPVCKPVYISTRSGAWVVPNYVFGHATDLYACRAFLMLPWKFATYIFEKVITLISGNPRRWKLNPKMRALQTQPTVSPTLIHHIQRKNIIVVPNIQYQATMKEEFLKDLFQDTEIANTDSEQSCLRERIEGKKVFFINGESEEFDHIIMCTGYKIDLPFLHEDVRQKVLDQDTNSITLYKNVFNPEIGSSLAFIGFVQPASGGVLTMSETQSRWFAEMCCHKVKLPSKSDMVADIKKEERDSKDRWYQSARHTIQKDPITYNDDIASMIGAKPSLLTHPSLAWRLMFSSCGAYQWRLQGPHKWSGAYEAVKKVPLTEMMHYSGIAMLIVLGIFLYFFYRVISCIL